MARRDGRMWLILALCSLLLAACGGGEPRPIALQPQAQPPAAAPVGQEVRATYVELLVRDSAASAAHAEQIAASFGGHVLSQQGGRDSGGPFVQLTLAVPASRYDEASLALLTLGALIESRGVRSSLPPAPGGPEPTTAITLLLRSAGATALTEGPALSPAPPPLPPARPVQTLQSAWSLLSAIALFLLDIAIWLAVVVGPFALVGGGLRHLRHRYEWRDGRPSRRERPLPPPQGP